MDIYDEILEFYESKNRTERETKEWCYRKIFELISHNTLITGHIEIENSLILILNLFFIKEPDLYHKKGKLSKNLNQNEKKLLQDIMKSEVNA